MSDITLTGPCTDYEHDLVDLHEGVSAPGRTPAVRLHLTQCPRCRRWLEEFAALDADLAARLPRPALSAGFDERLRERLASLSRRASPAEQRAAADAEYRHAIEAIRRGSRRHAVLDAIASATLTGCALAAFHRLLEPLGALLPALDGPQRWISLGVLGSAVAAAALLWSARRGRYTLRVHP